MGSFSHGLRQLIRTVTRLLQALLRAPCSSLSLVILHQDSRSRITQPPLPFLGTKGKDVETRFAADRGF